MKSIDPQESASTRPATPTVRLLVEDPDLATKLEPAREILAERACLARARALSPGAWEPESEPAAEGGFGLFVLAGILCRRVGSSKHYGAELIGPGDLLRPWERIADWGSVPRATSWNVITQARVAVLDEEFSRRAAPFPEIAAALTGRALLRSRYLALSIAIVSERRVETRLHMLFWHLADRFGRVRGDSVVIEVPLTHALLSELTAARRPSVTKALIGLRERGILRREKRAWVLQGTPPGQYRELADAS